MILKINYHVAINRYSLAKGKSYSLSGRVLCKGFANFEEIFGDFELIICPEIQIDQIFRFWSMKNYKFETARRAVNQASYSRTSIFDKINHQVIKSKNSIWVYVNTNFVAGTAFKGKFDSFNTKIFPTD